MITVDDKGQEAFDESGFRVVASDCVNSRATVEVTLSVDVSARLEPESLLAELIASFGPLRSVEDEDKDEDGDKDEEGTFEESVEAREKFIATFFFNSS